MCSFKGSLQWMQTSDKCCIIKPQLLVLLLCPGEAGWESAEDDDQEGEEGSGGERKKRKRDKHRDKKEKKEKKRDKKDKKEKRKRKDKGESEGAASDEEGQQQGEALHRGFLQHLHIWPAVSLGGCCSLRLTYTARVTI
jgi:hypothetical protein